MGEHDDDGDDDGYHHNDDPDDEGDDGDVNVDEGDCEPSLCSYDCHIETTPATSMRTGSL